MKKILAFALCLGLLIGKASANITVSPPIPLPLSATSGGTGLSSFTTNCVISATNSSTLNCTTTPTLTGTNFTGVPFSGVTGTVPVAQGGTNITSYTTGDILYASASGTISKLAAVASGSLLASNGTSAAPIYTSAPAFSGANITSGTIPNAALVTTPPTQTCTTWTPTDQSGATLTLTVNSARYCTTGKLAMFQAEVVYPTTASAAQASLSLPVTCTTGTWWATADSNTVSMVGKAVSTTIIFVAQPFGGGGYANVSLSTGTVGLTGMCMTT